MNLKKDIIFQLYYLPRALLLTLIVVFAYLFVLTNKGHIKEHLLEVVKKPFVMLFLLYVSFLLVSTLLGRWPKEPYGYLFANFGIFNENGWNSEFVENTLLFIPYSFLFIGAFRPRRTLQVGILATLMFSCFIEFSQLFFWLGKFQLSDMVHNIMGGVIGCGIWYLVHDIKTKHVFSRSWKWVGKKVGKMVCDHGMFYASKNMKTKNNETDSNRL